MFGNPIQFSVFECDLSRRQIEVPPQTIRGIITADKDYRADLSDL
jgi:CRISPR/Cas system-associated endoribonuclease Cas2